MKQIMQLSDYNNLQEEDTVYIFGNSPQLAYLTDNQISELENKITVGTNASFMALESPYYIAGHMSVMFLMCHYTKKPSNKIFHGEPQHFPFESAWNVISVADKNIVGGPGYLPKPIDNSGPLVGAENVGISATHLAFIMGAKRIVYIGFDFKNSLHFYNVDKTKFDTMKLYVEELLEMYNYDDFLREDINDFYLAAFRPKEEMENTPFGINHCDYESSLNKFKAYFNTMKSNGVEVISTQENNILHKAGATYISLDDCLANN
jgi:hypothetical protein